MGWQQAEAGPRLLERRVGRLHVLVVRSCQVVGDQVHVVVREVGLAPVDGVQALLHVGVGVHAVPLLLEDGFALVRRGHDHVCAQVLVGKRAVERDHVACRREGHGQRQAVVLRVCQRMVDPGHHVQVQLGDLLLDILAVVERHVLEGEARRGRDAVEHVDGGARHLPGARVDGAHGSTVGKQPYAQRARVLDAGALGVAEFEHRPVFREIVREQLGGERGLALFDAVKHQVEVVRKARGLRGGEVEGPGREAQDGAEPVGNRHAHAQPHVGLSFFQRLEDLESAFARHQLVGKIHERGVGLEVGQAKDRVLPSGDPQGVDPVDGRGAYAVFADRSEQHRVGVPVAVDRVVEQLLQVLGVSSWRPKRRCAPPSGRRAQPRSARRRCPRSRRTRIPSRCTGPLPAGSRRCIPNASRLLRSP